MLCNQVGGFLGGMTCSKFDTITLDVICNSKHEYSWFDHDSWFDIWYNKIKLMYEPNIWVWRGNPPLSAELSYNYG